MPCVGRDDHGAPPKFDEKSGGPSRPALHTRMENRKIDFRGTTPSGGELDLRRALLEMMTRGKKVPGGTCGFWGACGAAISAGMFVSIITGSTPLAVESWGLANSMTAKALAPIGAVGGPRCCKRNSFLAIQAAVDFVREHFGVEMESQPVVCGFIPKNNQCIGKRCPFAPVNHQEA